LLTEGREKPVARPWAGILLILLLASAGRALVQEPYPPKRQPQETKQHPGPHPNARAGRKEPPRWFQRLREMPPQEQQRAMANDPQFRRLPPERQQKIKENLIRWNTLTPQEKETFRQREEVFQSLSPSQRDQLRSVFPRWRALDPGQQQELMQGFRQLRDMPPSERQSFLSSPETAKRFTPEERDILGKLNGLLPGSEGAPPAGESEPEE